MKKTFLLFAFVFSAIVLVALPLMPNAEAGQGGDEIRGLISIFRPTPMERKVEVIVEDWGYDLKFKKKIGEFAFKKERKVNVYRALLDGNQSAIMLLVVDNKPAGIIFYEPEDMPKFRAWLKKDENEKRKDIIKEFRKEKLAELE